MAVSLVALELEAHLDSIRIKTVTQFRYVALWVSGAFSGAHCGVFPLTSSWVCTPDGRCIWGQRQMHGKEEHQEPDGDTLKVRQVLVLL